MRFTEGQLCEIAQGAVDRDAGVIRGVKLLGTKSRNGRTYSEAALRDAAGLYDGARVHIDHDRSGKGRSLATRAAVVSNVSYQEGKGLYGDLKVMQGTPSGDLLRSLAEQSPETFGMSHDAEGEIKRRNGKAVVEKITRVHSVDAVDDPATNTGLYEDAMPATTLKSLVEATGYKWADRLFEMMPGDMDMAPDAELPAEEAPADEDADPVEAVKDVMAKKAVTIFKDDAKDPSQTAKEIKALAQAVANVKKQVEPAAEVDADAATDTDEKTEESLVAKLKASLEEAVVHVRAEVETVKRRNQAASLLAENGVGITESLIDRLAAKSSRDAMKAELDSIPPRELGRSKPKVERRRESAEPYLDFNEFKNRIIG